MSFIISRSIEVDAGHRVPTHGSKCANLHGHRYKVIAEVSSLSLQTEDADGNIKINEQQDMVLDFGFLKDILVEHVDALCDHGMILWCDDPWAVVMLDPRTQQPIETLDLLTEVRKDLPFHLRQGIRSDDPLSSSKLLIVPFIPTAERLAEFWYHQMKNPVRERSNYLASLHRIVVWETPNCSASYP